MIKATKKKQNVPYGFFNISRTRAPPLNKKPQKVLKNILKYYLRTLNIFRHC